MANTYLSRTASTGNRKTLTISYWLKRGNITTSNSQGVLNAGILSDGNNHSFCGFQSSTDTAIIQTTTSGSNVMSLQSNALFRDVSAWYHFVWKVDTTQATESDRITLYVNGVEHSLTGTYPSQNQDTWFNYADTHTVGTRFTNYFDGSMSHVHFIDGTAYDATAFGEYDANGVWTINTSPSVTYGTNGFFILKNGNSVTDQSGNGNNFTVGGGTLTNTEDSPSNVFATLNPLATGLTAGNFANGNTTHYENSGTWSSLTSTLGASSGKWYAEYKYTANSSSSNGQMAGIVNMDTTNYMNESSDLEQSGNKGIVYYANGTVFADPQVTVATYSSYGDAIIQIAMDLNNNKLYFGKDGTWQNSADPSAGTGGIDISNYIGTGTYAFGLANRNTGSTSANFGNGYFGTTAVASAGTNASGIGIFEYDVPTGYTALSTKGLNL